MSAPRGVESSPAKAWAVVSGACGSQFIAVFTALLFGYNLPFIREEMAADLATLSLAPSFYGLFYAGLSMLWGAAADRVGVRCTITTASLGVGACLLLIGFCAQGDIAFVVLYAMAGFFAAGLSMAVVPKLVSGWFPHSKRGKGILPASIGGGLAGVASGFIMPGVIGAVGWRGCFVVFGCVSVLLAALGFALIRDNGPYYAEERAGLRQSLSMATGVRTVLRMPITYLFGLMLILFNIYYTSNTSFEVSALTSAGFALSTVGLFESLNTGATVFGQLVFSPLADRYPRKRILGLMLICGGALYAGLYGIAGMGNSVLLCSYAVISGLFVAVVPVYQTLAAEYYPRHLRGSGPGVIASLSLVGRFAGPLVIGALISAVGMTHSMVFVIVAGGCLMLGGLIVLLLFPHSAKD